MIFAAKKTKQAASKNIDSSDKKLNEACNVCACLKKKKSILKNYSRRTKKKRQRKKHRQVLTEIWDLYRGEDFAQI